MEAYLSSSRRSFILRILIFNPTSQHRRLIGHPGLCAQCRSASGLWSSGALTTLARMFTTPHKTLANLLTTTSSLGDTIPFTNRMQNAIEASSYSYRYSYLRTRTSPFSCISEHSHAVRLHRQGKITWRRWMPTSQLMVRRLQEHEQTSALSYGHPFEIHGI